MSHVHIPPSPEQEAALRQQKRLSALASLFTSFAILALIAIILTLILLPTFKREVSDVVAYNMPSQDEEQVEQRQKTRVRSKPTAPSASQVRVIAANTASPVAIPVPELDLSDSEVSIDFGDGNDFGDGWEMSEMESDATGGGTTFFKQKVVAQRVAYVIDASRSMTKRRQELMRENLIKSLKKLREPMQYQIIFFSAPAWVAGSEQEFDFEEGEATFKDDSGSYEWEGNKGSYRGWEPKGKEQPVPWIEYNAKSRRKSIEHVEEQVMYLGTDWGPPLKMALEMEPAPQVIFFMTDGAGGKTDDLLSDLKRLARRKKTIINTVALMEPEAIDGLEFLAKETGGQFTIVDEKGRVEIQELD